MAAISASTHLALNCVPAPPRSSLERGLLAQRPAVGAGGGHRVERIGHVNDRRLDQARPVDGGVGGFGRRVTRNGREEVDAPQQFDRHGLVPLHPFELRLGEATRLVEQLIRDDQLADVVHQRRIPKPLHPARAEREFDADVLGESCDSLCMARGVAVLRLERQDQGLDRLLLASLEFEVAGERAPRDQDWNDQERDHNCARARDTPIRARHREQQTDRHADQRTAARGGFPNSSRRAGSRPAGSEARNERRSRWQRRVPRLPPD